MSNNTVAYSTVMTSNPLYALPNQVAQSVANSVLTHVKTNSEADLQDKIDRLRDQNQELQRKLHNKINENGKLQNKVERLTAEMQMLKELLTNIERAVSTGQDLPPINFDLNATMAAAKMRVKKHRKNKPTADCPCCFVAEKPYACDFENCFKRFKQRAHLEAHRNVHLGQRFACTWPSCTKSFCRKYSLMEHEKTHRSGNPNRCNYPECGKSFSSKYGLQRHQMNQNHIGY